MPHAPLETDELSPEMIAQTETSESSKNGKENTKCRWRVDRRQMKKRDRTALSEKEQIWRRRAHEQRTTRIDSLYIQVCNIHWTAPGAWLYVRICVFRVLRFFEQPYVSSIFRCFSKKWDRERFLLLGIYCVMIYNSMLHSDSRRANWSKIVTCTFWHEKACETIDSRKFQTHLQVNSRNSCWEML